MTKITLHIREAPVILSIKLYNQRFETRPVCGTRMGWMTESWKEPSCCFGGSLSHNELASSLKR